jgi:hypothetical protein
MSFENVGDGEVVNPKKNIKPALMNVADARTTPTMALLLTVQTLMACRTDLLEQPRLYI